MKTGSFVVMTALMFIQISYTCRSSRARALRVKGFSSPRLRGKVVDQREKLIQ